MNAATSQATRILSGRSSRFAAMQMDLGNLISMLLPPLPVRWFGGSIPIYVMHRHRPNPRVGRYTQRAAYRFFAVIGRGPPGRRLFSRPSLYVLADRLGSGAAGRRALVAVVHRAHASRGLARYRTDRNRFTCRGGLT